MRYIILVLAISLIATVPNLNAGVITLDFDTPETGSEIVTTPLVSPLGTITASASGVSRIFLIPFPGDTGDGLRHDQVADSDFGQLAFDFDVDSVSFLYAGFVSGDFRGEVLDSSLTVIDSFQDEDTDDDLPGGPITLSGSGIRYFRFADTPGSSSFVGVDNVAITSSADPEVPEPGTLAIFGLGAVMSPGLRRRRRK